MTEVENETFPVDEGQEEQPAESAPESEQASGDAERKGTTYILLQARALGEDEVFVPIKTHEAGNGDAAIRDHMRELLAEGQAQGGRFVAVPARSWVIRDVEVEASIKIGQCVSEAQKKAYVENVGHEPRNLPEDHPDRWQWEYKGTKAEREKMLERLGLEDPDAEEEVPVVIEGQEEMFQ